MSACPARLPVPTCLALPVSLTHLTHSRRYFEMVDANQAAAELALQLYSDCVRWLLLVGGGYECQVCAWCGCSSNRQQQQS